MDKEENFLSVLSNTNIESLLSTSEILTIQAKLWDILAERTESYTMGGSSSVRIETAQALLKSAGFVIKHGVERGPDTDVAPELLKEQLLSGDFDAFFRSGLKEIASRVEEGQMLLDMAVKTATAVENGAYHDTLRELGGFFKRYHYHHFAHEIPCMIDYPLARPVDESLLGIDYVNEYLRRLLIENAFCGRFRAETVTALLKSVAPDYKENILSTYEIIAANALALTLLKGDVTSLDVTGRDLDRLYSLLNTPAEGDAVSVLMSASSELCDILSMRDDAERAYLTETASAFTVRVRLAVKARQLNYVFPPLYREREVKQRAAYIDGALMDDEKLRGIIGEITSCRYVSDKIAIVKDHVHSLRDLAEILNICFWGEEIKALFDALDGDELEHLRSFAARQVARLPEWRSETGWETALAGYKRNKMDIFHIY